MVALSPKSKPARTSARTPKPKPPAVALGTTLYGLVAVDADAGPYWIAGGDGRPLVWTSRAEAEAFGAEPGVGGLDWPICHVEVIGRAHLMTRPAGPRGY